MNRLIAIFQSPLRNRVLLGAALLLIGLVLLGFTEHTDRLRAVSEDALGGFVLSGQAAKPGPDSNGQLVLAVGAPKIVAPARDAQFGVTAAAPALVRKVEMFQWNETDFGGQRGYEMNWFDHPIDSSGFTAAAEHANPGAFPLSAARFDSPGVVVAGFKLAPALVHQIPGVEPFKPALNHLPANMAATFRAHDGVLTSSESTRRPRIGDLRISWMKIAPAYLTVFARDHDGTLVPTQDPAGDQIAQVMVGRMSLTDVLTDAPQPPHFKWARRVLAVLLAWAGVALLLPVWDRSGRILALAIAAVPLAALAAAYWWGVRMPATIVLIFIAVAGMAVATWRWRGMVRSEDEEAAGG